MGGVAPPTHTPTEAASSAYTTNPAVRASRILVVVFDTEGVVDMNGGALNDAINAFEAAARTAPSDGVDYFNLGRALETRFIRARGPLRAGGSRSATVANGLDRDRAVKAHRQYLAIGGASVDAARAGLSRLGAKDKE